MKNYFTKYNFPGSLATIVLSTLVLYLLFGELLRSPNTVYFAGSGDGLKSYYGTLYHVTHDTTYARFTGMNYPYGEMILFTDNQPVVANTIKFISEKIIDISGHTIGILNLLMLFSIVIAALFIYLILRELKLPVPVSVVLGVAIAFLSPQIGRLGGHFSLSYLFFIPLMIYLLIRFHKHQSYWVSITIGIVTLLAAFTHMYFLGFFGILFLFYWITLIITERTEFGNYRVFLPHLLIQVILPVACFYLYSAINDPVTDRTASPWGFLYYRAYPESVFLPVGKPYGKFLDRIMTFNHIDWEGWAYIGLIGLVGFIFLIIQIGKKTWRKNFSEILRVTDNKLLNIFFWASFAALLYSFGLPFIMGLEGWLDYLGPVRQMRGIARFSWLFFYVINVVTFYLLWNWLKEKKRTVVYWSLLLLPLLFIFYDAWLNARSMEYYMNNRIPMLDDRENRLPENQWIIEIDPADYQAIIPIPYFHVGSENIWIDSRCEMMKHVFIASLKTGLPTNGVMLSRTSISQSFRNIELVMEPYREPVVLEDLPNRKPFLVLASKCDEMSRPEQQLLERADYITDNDLFTISSIQVNTLSEMAGGQKTMVIDELKTRELFPQEEFLVSDSSGSWFYNGFEDAAGESYFGKSGYSGNIKEYNTIYFGNLPGAMSDSLFVISFWLGDARKDLVPRSTIEFALTDSTGRFIHAEYRNLGNLYTSLDDDWALLEYSMISTDPGNQLKVTIWNQQLKKETLHIDELLIRQSSLDVYREIEGGVSKNNRFFFQNK